MPLQQKGKSLLKIPIPNDWDNRLHKKSVREYLLDEIPKSKSSLWLPSNKAECIKSAIRTGIVTPATKLVCVERDQKVFKEMKNEVLQLLDWHHAPCLFHGDLIDLKPKQKFDLCFLDFLGTIESYNLLNWIKNILSPQIEKGATIGITLTYSWRNNQCMHNLSKIIQRHSEYKKLSREWKITNKYLLVPMALIKIIFCNWDFKIYWPAKYRDSTRSMLFYKLTDFQISKQNSNWPSLENLISKKGKKIMPAKTKKGRKEAAIKAWETRKQNTTIKFLDVVNAVFEEKRGHKKMLEKYVDQQVSKNGSEPNRIIAAVKACVSRKQKQPA